MSRKRRPWIAALLSLVGSPGLGQLYNGGILKAALFLLGMPLAALLLLWSATVLPSPPTNMFIPLAVLLGLQILTIVDAAKDASRLREVPRPLYGRWYSLAAVWLLNASLIIPAWRAVLLTSCIQAFKIPTGGMERTVLIGDHLLVDKASYGLRLPFSGSRIVSRRPPQRGDVIAFLHPEDRGRVLLKRVIGLPGEKVHIRDKVVLIDHVALEEPYARYLDSVEEQQRPDWDPVVVPPGHLYVLGDNRDNSRDSRYWGFVPIDDVLGKAKVIYFSWDGSARRVRWERTGHILH